MDGWMDALHDQLTLASSAYSCISLRSPERSASLSTVLPSLPAREAPLSLLATLVDDDDAVLSRAVPVLPSGSLSVLFGLNLMMNSLPVSYICGVWVIWTSASDDGRSDQSTNTPFEAMLVTSCTDSIAQMGIERRKSRGAMPHAVRTARE
jgi:hypothetical protein